MSAAVQDLRADTSPAAIARRAASLTLEDRVQICLTNPDAVGCIVCGGTARRRSGGVSCRDCGSELEWGSAPRGVWVG
jgi:hypothetical protein